MNTPVFSKILFTVTYPATAPGKLHIPLLKLHSLARKQLTDQEIIDTIDHLFKCTRCLDNYRRVWAGYPQTTR